MPFPVSTPTREDPAFQIPLSSQQPAPAATPVAPARSRKGLYLAPGALDLSAQQAQLMRFAAGLETLVSERPFAASVPAG